MDNGKGAPPSRGKIQFPLSRGHCKRCKRVYWWGRMAGSKRYYPPFDNEDGTAWHICNTSGATLAIADEQDTEEQKQRQKEIARKREEKKNLSRALHALTFDGLIQNIQAHCNVLRTYGRPVV